MTGDITTALATLHAYARSCHDEIGQAGGRVASAYEELLALWAEQTAQRVAAEREREALSAALREATMLLRGHDIDIPQSILIVRGNDHAP